MQRKPLLSKFLSKRGAEAAPQSRAEEPHRADQRGQDLPFTGVRMATAAAVVAAEEAVTAEEAVVAEVLRILYEGREDATRL